MQEGGKRESEINNTRNGPEKTTRKTHDSPFVHSRRRPTPTDGAPRRRHHVAILFLVLIDDRCAGTLPTRADVFVLCSHCFIYKNNDACSIYPAGVCIPSECFVEFIGNYGRSVMWDGWKCRGKSSRECLGRNGNTKTGQHRSGCLRQVECRSVHASSTS